MREEENEEENAALSAWHHQQELEHQQKLAEAAQILKTDPGYHEFLDKLEKENG